MWVLLGEVSRGSGRRAGHEYGREQFGCLDEFGERDGD